MNPAAIAPEVAQAIAAALATNKPQEIIDATKVPAILVDNYFQMRRMNDILKAYGLPTAGTDDFYHQKAQSESARLGLIPMLTAQALGYLKESFDVPKNLFWRGLDAHTTAQDFKKDLTINAIGSTVKEKDLPQIRSEGMKRLYKALRNEN